MRLDVEWDSRMVEALGVKRIRPAFARAMRKAGATGLRDMKAEASKRIRARKRLKAGLIGKAFRLRRPKGKEIDGGEWALDVRGTKVALAAFPHRQTKKGVSVEVNRGKRSLIQGGFVATMRSGHKGIFKREGKSRLPIREFFGSRPVDALLHKGEAEAVQQRGARSMVATFNRVLPLELEKAKSGAK